MGSLILYMFYMIHMQDGNTALIWASANGFSDAVQALMDAGADASIQNNVGDKFYKLVAWRY